MSLHSALLEGYRVTIGGVDVTRAIAGAPWLSLQYPKITEDGLFPGSGNITLVPSLGATFAAGFFSPRTNSQQWQRGQSVVIEVSEGGTFEPRFTGFILRDPNTPRDTRSPLLLEIGDELVFRNIDSPAGDGAGLRLGSEMQRSAIVSAIAAHIGWTGTISLTMPEYPISYPIPKHSGSFVRQMGAIAASAGYGLHCDGMGVLKAAKLNPQPVSVLSRTWQNAIIDPKDGNDDPAAKVQAVVTGRSVTPSPTCTVSQFTREASAVTQGAVGVGGDFGVETYIARRETITEKWLNNYKTRTFSKQIELPEVRSQVALGATGAAVSIDFTLVLRSISTQTDTYSSAVDGKLLIQKDQIITGPAFIPPTVQGLAVIEATEPQETSLFHEVWSYNGDVPARKERYAGAIAEENLREVTTWDPLDNDRWRKTEQTIVPLTLLSGAIVDTGITDVFVGKEYAPREAVIQIPTHQTEEVAYMGCAEFGGITSTSSEVPIYEFEYGVSDFQAEELAELHGAIRNGRHRSGQQVTVEHSALWKNWTPGAAVELTLRDGAIARFLSDGFSVNLSEQNGLVTLDCVNMGTVGSLPYTKPVGQVLDGTETPTTPPTPTTTALIPPYTPINAGEHSGRWGVEGEALVVSQPRNVTDFLGGRFGFDGEAPFGAEDDLRIGRLGSELRI